MTKPILDLRCKDFGLEEQAPEFIHGDNLKSNPKSKIQNSKLSDEVLTIHLGWLYLSEVSGM
ncbi:MAG: hypothetical protein AB1589_31285 [Cyanobacteriota bacterium]